MATETLSQPRIADDPAIARMRMDAPNLVAQAHALDITMENATVTVPQADEIISTCLRVKKLAAALTKKFLKPFQDVIDQKKLEIKDEILAPAAEADMIARSKLIAYETERREFERTTREKQAADAMARDEEDRLQRAIRLAEQAKSTGDEYYNQLAEATLDQPSRPRIQAVVEVPPKPASVTEGEKPTDVLCHDIVALAAAVASGHVQSHAITPNLAWLKREAGQRGREFAVPGCEVVWAIGTRAKA